MRKLDRLMKEAAKWREYIEARGGRDSALVEALTEEERLRAVLQELRLVIIHRVLVAWDRRAEMFGEEIVALDDERREFAEHPDMEKSEMREYYIGEGFSAHEAESFINHLSLDRDRWLKAHVTHVLGFVPGRNSSPIKDPLRLEWRSSSAP